MTFNEIPYKVEMIDKFGKKWVWYKSTTAYLQFSNNLDVYVTREKGGQRVKIREANQMPTLPPTTGSHNA